MTRLLTDRVYGIMHVFDLQLGNSAPGYEARQHTVDELTDQLGHAILRKFPITHPGMNIKLR